MQDPPPSRPPRGIPADETLYAAFTAIFCVVLVLTNIVGVKLFEVFPDGGPEWLLGGGGLTLTTGILTYPITFLVTDVVSEIWGHRRAGVMVWLGFGTSLLMLGVLALAKGLPPSAIWAVDEYDAAGLQAAFDVTFRFPALLLFASMLAYLVAQLFDVRLYHFWWRVTGGKHMWIRNNGSTSISQLVDTIIVNGIYLYFGLEMEVGAVAEIIVAVYACKLVLALLDTPLIYLARHVVRARLGLAQEAAPGQAPLA